MRPVGTLALAIVCVAAADARADEPGDTADVFALVAPEARIAAAWISGRVLRDAGAVSGTPVAFRRDMDLDEPAPWGTVGLRGRLGGSLEAFGSCAWLGFEGRAPQPGASLFGPPPTLVLDGVAFTGQVLESRVRLIFAEVGVSGEAWRRDHARLRWRGGAAYLGASDRVRAVGGPTLEDTTDAFVPFIGTEVAADDGRFVVAARLDLGLLAAGDRSRSQVNARVAAGVEVALRLDRLAIALHLDWVWFSSERRHGREEEEFEVSALGPGVSIGFRL